MSSDRFLKKTRYRFIALMEHTCIVPVKIYYIMYLLLIYYIFTYAVLLMVSKWRLRNHVTSGEKERHNDLQLRTSFTSSPNAGGPNLNQVLECNNSPLLK